MQAHGDAHKVARHLPYRQMVVDANNLFEKDRGVTQLAPITLIQCIQSCSYLQSMYLQLIMLMPPHPGCVRKLELEDIHVLE